MRIEARSRGRSASPVPDCGWGELPVLAESPEPEADDRCEEKKRHEDEVFAAEELQDADEDETDAKPGQGLRVCSCVGGTPKARPLTGALSRGGQATGENSGAFSRPSGGSLRLSAISKRS